jgi:predicted metal-binding membrane protein
VTNSHSDAADFGKISREFNPEQALSSFILGLFPVIASLKWQWSEFRGACLIGDRSDIIVVKNFVRARSDRSNASENGSARAREAELSEKAVGRCPLAITP